MNYRTDDNILLYYETHGDPAAPPLLLIHGIGADHAMWKPQIASLPAAGYFVIIPDLRGHGLSEVPPVFRMADCVHDMSGLLNSIGVSRAHLIGVSMGGMVVQQFTAQYPAAVLSQIIVDSLSGVTRPVERFNAWLAAVLLQFFPPPVQARMVSRAYAKLGHAEVGEYFTAQLLRMEPQWLLAARREVNRFTIIHALQHMQVPTLVLAGDSFGRLAIDMARTTATLIPGARLQILTGGGDPSNLLVPEAFDKAVLDFLNGMQHNK